MDGWLKKHTCDWTFLGSGLLFNAFNPSKQSEYEIWFMLTLYTPIKTLKPLTVEMLKH